MLHQATTQPSEPTDVELIIYIDTRITEIQTKTQGRLLFSRGRAIAGIELNKALADYLECKHKLLIGRFTAELAVLSLGSAYVIAPTRTMIVRGRDADHGEPKAVEITDAEVSEAIEKVIEDIVSYIALNLKYAMPKGYTLSDVEIIALEGDFGKIKRLDERLSTATDMKIQMR